MRSAFDARICSIFRYLESQLTVFLGARIAGKALPSEMPSKSFALGARGQKYGVATTLFLRGFAPAGSKTANMYSIKWNP